MASSGVIAKWRHAGDGGAGIDEKARRRNGSPAVEGARRKHGGHGARSGEESCAVLGDVLQVVDAGSAESNGKRERDGAAGAFCVDLAPHPEGLGAVEIARVDLLTRDDVVPPEVEELGDSAALDARRKLGDDLVGVLVGGAVGHTQEEGWGNVDGAGLEAGDDPQGFQLGAFVGAATGLDLDGGGAVARHGVDEWPGARLEEAGSRRAHGAGRALAIGAVVAAGRVDKMRVAVDEPGH
jgi:hypothetical protein